MGFMRRLYAVSIWYPGAIPPLDVKYAMQKRVLWPLVDVFYIWIGVVAGLYGAPSINAVFGMATSRALCFTFALVSFAALLGIAFPRLWYLESIAKVILVGAHVALIASLGSAAFELDALSRLYLIGFVAVSMAHILFRLHILRDERLEREAPSPEEDDE